MRLKRKELGMTQKQVAEAIEVEKSLVSKWELGKHSLQGSTMQRLAELFRIDLKEIYEDRGGQY